MCGIFEISMGRQGWSPVVGMVLLVLGCGNKTDVVFPNHVKDYLPPPANPGFSAYLQASELVERDCAKWIGRVSFTPGQQAASIRAAGPAVSKIRKGQSDGVSWVHRPYSPFSPPSERRGWRFIGRVLDWRIQDAIESKDFDRAVEDTLTAVQMGIDLSGGDAIDANLGYTIARQATSRIWSHFTELSPKQLSRLSSRIAFALERAPTIEATLRNEKITMLKAVQQVQDCFLSNDLKPINEALGSVITPATDYLNRMKTRPKEEQVKFFNGFASEAVNEADSLTKMAQTAPSQWKPLDDPEGERPWKRFATAYLRTGREFMNWWVEFQARTRLMALDAGLMSRVKSGEQNIQLSRFPKLITIDPYSGQTFRYLPQGRDFVVYSIGKDRRDDSGDSNRDLLPER